MRLVGAMRGDVALEPSSFSMLVGVARGAACAVPLAASIPIELPRLYASKVYHPRLSVPGQGGDAVRRDTHRDDSISRVRHAKG